MYSGLLHSHSLLRWLALVAIIVAISRAYSGLARRRSFTGRDNMWSLLTLIFFHLQLVIGFVLYFTQGWHLRIGEMANATARFFALEHTVGMLVAIALVTVGRVSAKKVSDDRRKHKRHFAYFLIALIIAIVSIPWPFREVSRSWFPGL